METPNNKESQVRSTKMVNHLYTKNDEVGLAEFMVRYTQNEDTCGIGDNYQMLRLENVGLEFNAKENTDAFIRMTTGNPGPDDDAVSPYWSINGLEDLVTIFNDFEKRRGSNIRYELSKIVTPNPMEPENIEITKYV